MANLGFDTVGSHHLMEMIKNSEKTFIVCLGSLSRTKIQCLDGGKAQMNSVVSCLLSRWIENKQARSSTVAAILQVFLHSDCRQLI
jgi:hypothetical protein